VSREPLEVPRDEGKPDRVRAGASARRQAAREAFDAMRDELFAVCLHLGGDVDTADEALAATFAFVVAAAGFRAEIPFASWVHRAAIVRTLKARARRGATPPQAPAEERVASALFAVDSLSPARVAEIMGVSEEAAWARLAAARRRTAKRGAARRSG
jgi:DNA-directed RNA polymerase specialized sigma24 family protein